MLYDISNLLKAIMWSICSTARKQDKNRDVIVAFPDVDPSIISVAREGGHHYGKGKLLRRPDTDTYDHPHLWYSTSEVIRALELFIADGDELLASNTYRFTSLSFHHILKDC